MSVLRAIVADVAATDTVAHPVGLRPDRAELAVDVGGRNLTSGRDQDTGNKLLFRSTHHEDPQ